MGDNGECGPPVFAMRCGLAKVIVSLALRPGVDTCVYGSHAACTGFADTAAGTQRRKGPAGMAG